MPIKPLSHLRPLLRLPTHPTPPTEHFTANPSLLHHLPQSQGAHANALAAQAASAASSGGSNAGSRGGFNAGGAGNHGYTGHARAFLSLPQTVQLDPSAALNSNDDNNAYISPRSSLLLRHRLASQSHTQIIQLPEDGPRRVKKSIEARSGSSRVGIVEIEEGAGRRASIAFPTLRPVEASTSRQSTITPRGLARTRSTVDLWALPTTSPRPGLGVRALSTRSTSIPLPEVELESDVAVVEEVFVNRNIPSATPAFKQPNRVLMDLAGLDTPRRLERLQTRRYSVSAVQQSEAIPEEAEPPVDENQVTSGESGSAADLDRGIFMGILTSRSNGRTQDCGRLINHYRAPRDTSSFDPTTLREYPLPPGYDVRTYNLILETYLFNRTAGSSIAPILEAYNEMLDRDVVPNIKTYNEVIRALALREADVQSAVKRFEEDQAWAQWRSRNLGDEYDEAGWAEKKAIVDGYSAEGNLNSALRLFGASRGMGARDYAMKWSETVTAFHLPVLNALALQKDISAKDLDVALQIFQDAGQKKLGTRRTLFGPLATIFGKGGEEAKGRLEGLWEEFMDGEKAGVGLQRSDWGYADSSDQKTRGILNAKELRNVAANNRKLAWTEIATAFVKLGDVEKAKEIITTMIESGPKEGEAAQEDSEYEDQEGGIPQVNWSTPEPTSVIYPVMIALAEVKRFEEVKDVFESTFAFIQGRLPFGQRNTAHSLTSLVNTLLLADQLDLALHITTKYSPLLTREVSPILQPVRQILYAAVDHRASVASSQEEAVALLDRLIGIGGLRVRDTKSHFDVNGAVRHCYALLQAGQADRIEKEMQTFYSEVEIVEHPALLGEGQVDISDFVEQLAQQESLALSLKLIILERLLPRRPFSSKATAKLLLDQYYATRTAPSTKTAFDVDLAPRGWLRLVRFMTQLPAETLAEGEHDELLQTFMGDLGALSGQAHDYLSKYRDRKPEDRQAMSTLAGILVDRFGRDRAKEMLSPIVGETSALLDEVTTAAEASGSEAETTLQTPETSDVESLGSFRPVSPSFVAPEQPLQSNNDLRVSDRLTLDIDRHTFKNPQITALQAYDILENRLRAGEAPTPEAIARLLDNIGRTGLENEYKVHKLYSLGNYLISKLPTNAQIQPWWLLENAMLIATCHLGYLEQAGLHRAQLVAAGYPPGADAYATMIASAKDTTDDALVARELWDESRAVGVKANMFLYNTIISKLSKARKAEMALDLFKHMKASGIRPSSVTYGAVINACCRVGDGESAATLFNEMTESPNFKPRVPPFNTMMQFHLTTQPSRAKVLQYFQSLQSFKVPPSAHTYKLLLDAYATLPPLDLQTMVKVFAALCADPYVDVQGTHWSSLIAAHGVYGNDVPKAMEIFESIPSHPSTRRRKAKRGQSPSASPMTEPVVWESILNVIAQRGTLQELTALLQQMQQHGPHATAYVNNVLIAGYSRLDRVDLAREVFESMGDSVQGVAAPNNHPTLLTSSGHIKPSTVTNRPTGVVYREPSTYDAMIRAELKAGEKGRAEEVLRRMEERMYPVAVYMKSRAILDEYTVASSRENAEQEKPMPSHLFGPRDTEGNEGLSTPVYP